MTYIHYIILFTNTISGVLGLYLVFTKGYVLNRCLVLQKARHLGLWVGSVGLLAQAYWSYVYIAYGEEVALTTTHLWVFKDIAITVIILTLFFISLDKKLVKA